MAFDRNDRYPTAQAMGEALAGYLYANAPTFSTDQLSKLLSYFYEKELVAEGLPVSLPRDFLEQVPLWKKTLPTSTSETDSGVRETTAGRGKKRGEAEISTRAAERSQSGVRGGRATKEYVHPPDQPRRLPKWPFLVMPVVAAAAAGLLVFAIGGGGTFSVQVASSPKGAQVTIDGALAPSPAPILISELGTDRAHSIEVSAPGYKTWSRQVLAERDETLQLEAVLEPAPPPVDLVVVPPVEPPKPVVAPVVRKTALKEYKWPIGEVIVDARDHSFDIQSTKAARIRLDPTKTYRIWTEGKVSLGGIFDNIFMEQAFFALEGDVAGKDGFGIVDRKGVTVKGATVLYAWLFDVKPNDNSGAVKVRVQAKGSSAISTVLVDGRENMVDLDPQSAHRVRINNFPYYGSVEVLVRYGDPPAALDGSKRGRTNKVIYHQNSGYSVASGVPTAHQDQQILLVGKKYVMTGVNWMVFTFPDARADDNSGTLIIEVASVAGSGGGTFKGVGGFGN